MENNELTLRKFKFIEYVDEKIDIDIKESEFGNINLVLGDNAQGKTRLVLAIRFLRDIHKGARALLKPNGCIVANLVFETENIKDEIVYNLEIKLLPDNLTPNFNEEITRNGKTIFSRKNLILLDEEKDINISQFYIAGNVPCIMSLSGNEFKTINLLKSFFERIVLLESNRLDTSNIEITGEMLFLNDRGRNASSVLENWKIRLPQVYEEVVTEFEDVFSFIKKNSTMTRIQSIQGTNVIAPMLFFTDKDNDIEIGQINWSDGMLRIVCLIMLPLTRFINNANSFKRPSLLLVDEIENGLDFTTLSHIINFYEGWSSQMQIVLTSHSPTVCNLVSPEKWRIAKRKGEVVKFLNPSTVEENLENSRKKLLKDNWEFYKRHIAKSKLYQVH